MGGSIADAIDEPQLGSEQSGGGTLHGCTTGACEALQDLRWHGGSTIFATALPASVNWPTGPSRGISPFRSWRSSPCESGSPARSRLSTVARFDRNAFPSCRSSRMTAWTAFASPSRARQRTASIQNGKSATSSLGETDAHRRCNSSSAAGAITCVSARARSTGERRQPPTYRTLGPFDEPGDSMTSTPRANRS